MMKRLALGMALLMGTCSLSVGQIVDKKIKHGVVLGWPSELLSERIKGLYFGYNPLYPIDSFFYAEGLVAYAFSNYNQFFSGTKYRLDFLTVQGGLRLSLAKKGKTDRMIIPFVNCLVGLSSGNYIRHYSQPSEEIKRFTSFCFSTGLFVEYRKSFSLGASLEMIQTPLMVFKAKYLF